MNIILEYIPNSIIISFMNGASIFFSKIKMIPVIICSITTRHLAQVRSLVRLLKSTNVPIPKASAE